MKTANPTSADLYYTKDHEWISFQGAVAYTGVCTFKLIGFKEIQQVDFNHPLCDQTLIFDLEIMAVDPDKKIL